ncbi:hypothetical protein ACFL0U_00775 [Pseudomonadota bacterium]
MHKIPNDYIKVIKKIYNKLLNPKIEWYITGKTNLVLQGINTKPSHIGILIHEKDLQNFLSLFEDYKKSKIVELKNGEAKEFTIHIENVKVLVCAEYDHETYWTVFKKPTLLELENIKLPCFNLKSEKDAYINLGMLKKARIIEEFIRKTTT